MKTSESRGEVSKRYYWLKLKDDFFKQREIKKLRKIAGGDTFTIIYLKMQLLAIKSEGWLYFEGTEKDMLQQLELELDEEIGNIEVVVNFLQLNNLLEINDSEDYYLTETTKCIGKEVASAERVRRHREKQKNVLLQSNVKVLQSNAKSLQSNTNVTKCNTEIEKEREKDIEKEAVVDLNLDLCKKNQPPPPEKIYQENI